MGTDNNTPNPDIYNQNWRKPKNQKITVEIVQCGCFRMSKNNKEQTQEKEDTISDQVSIQRELEMQKLELSPFVNNSSNKDTKVCNTQINKENDHMMNDMTQDEQGGFHGSFAVKNSINA